MKNLILYGSQNLSNKKFGVETLSNFRGSFTSIQKIRNARFEGSTVVDKKIDERTISANGTIRATDDLTLQEVLNEYSEAFDKSDRYFRVSVNYHVFTDLEDSTGWQLQGDSEELSFDEEVFQYGDGAVRFDTETSNANTYCGVYSETGTETDLSSYGNEGAFEAWVYIPQTTGVTTIELSVGNDSSNYYSDTVSKQYDGTAFERGWNYVSFLVRDMDITGTIDPYSVGEYISLKVNYNSLMEDNDDFRLGGVLWQEEARTRNFRAYIEDFNVDMKHFDISRANYNLYVFAYEGVAESTGSYTVLGSAGESSATYNEEVEFAGTYTPLPKFTMEITSATNVSNVVFSNITTGDSVEITRTYAADEKLIIDTDKREVLVDGDKVDYDDVLPRFILGKNDIQVVIETTALETVDELTEDSNLTGEV